MTYARPAAGDTSKGWLRTKKSTLNVEYYPAGMTVEAPSLEHPMQHLSPVAAVLAARAVGCRLPTSAEWKAAVVVAGTAPQNLRDLTWRKQFEQAKELLRQGADPEYPGSGIFWPQSMQAQKLQPTQDGFAAVDADDSVLWFSPVGSGPKFQHLIGNVSEYVWEDRGALEGLEASGDRIKAALGRGEQLRVIGGSALSPKEILVSEPHTVSFAQAMSGYSDVGFRLAFTAPKGAGASSNGKLEEALAKSGYLPRQER